MKLKFHPSPIALAAVAALGALAAVTAPTLATAAPTAGKYVAGDFHNHSTCSDGSISVQKKVSKSTAVWGLDWFVQSGHGGSGNRNCTLAEDATLDTPAYPFVAGKSPSTTWVDSGVTVKGDMSGSGSTRNMWRWQSVQEMQYPLMEYLSALKSLPMFMGVESVVAGHEHSSMSVITGQMPSAIDTNPLPTTPGYNPLGNATALAKWEYCFDRNDADKSRGNTTGTSTGNNWDCSVTGSANASDPSWDATAQKLVIASGTGAGTRGHMKTQEAIKWMKENHANGSYYVPAHLERAGPFNADGNNGFNVEHLRNFNNISSDIAFGFETQPGHHASSNRGEYSPKRNNIGGVLTDSVGGTTYGGTGVYGAQIGGVWDALLGEGRRFWFFASSDWHNRGIFGADDLRSTQDFYPGEYQRNYALVRNGADKLRPQTIVDGLRSGNNWAANGQLIDRLSLIACVSNATKLMSEAQAAQLAFLGAQGSTSTDNVRCATMGQKLVVNAGDDVVVGIAVRDPEGVNASPYSFDNPSLLQIGVNQPLNMPVLDHIDVIGGKVSGFKTPGSAAYSGEWPRNTAWLREDGTTAKLNTVPAAAKNPSSALLKTFNMSNWTGAKSAADKTRYVKMGYTIPAVMASQYVRLRGTNLPASVPYETDANGNPLADLFTNAGNPAKLTIPCTTVGTNVPETGTPWTSGTINGCPKHLAVATSPSPIAGQSAVSYDVAAWADLWFHSNPIYVQVTGSTVVAGVN